MNQKISPAVSIVAVLLTVGIAGYLLWYSNRERPAPTHFGLPKQLQNMENARASSFLPKPGTSDKKKQAGDKDSKKAVRTKPMSRKEAMAAEMRRPDNGN